MKIVQNLKTKVKGGENLSRKKKEKAKVFYVHRRHSSYDHTVNFIAN